MPAAAAAGKGKGKDDKGNKKKGPAGARTAATERRLAMYKSGKPKRNRHGEIVQAAEFQAKTAPPGRVEPDRRWFGNVHVVGQAQLARFRSEMAKTQRNPYAVLLRQRNVPWALIPDDRKDAAEAAASEAAPLSAAAVATTAAAATDARVLEVEPFSETFGPRATRKRVRASETTSDLQAFADAAARSAAAYDEARDRTLARARAADAVRVEKRQKIYEKGQSKRIWGELWKVVDSSDVVVEVLDARDPVGTRCRFVEDLIRRKMKHKHLVLVLNKCDLIPTWATARWVQLLSREFPTLAFHASMQNPFGKGSLIQLLRQYAALHKDQPQISVGFVGYPNVGKSSIINTLRSQRVCKVAPIAGETKTWQYILLMKRIFLIDCPGVVTPSDKDSESDIVLRGVVRVENVHQPEDHIPALLSRAKREYISKTYDIETWTDAEDFLTQFASKKGKLLRGGEPDFPTCAKMILNDWLRGRIPYFVPPPLPAADQPEEKKPTEPVVLPVEPVEEEAEEKEDAQSGGSGGDEDGEEEAAAATDAPLKEPKVEEQDLSGIHHSMTFLAEDQVEPGRSRARAPRARAPPPPQPVPKEDKDDDEEEDGGRGEISWDEVVLATK